MDLSCISQLSSRVIRVVPSLTFGKPITQAVNRFVLPCEVIDSHVLVLGLLLLSLVDCLQRFFRKLAFGFSLGNVSVPVCHRHVRFGEFCPLAMFSKPLFVCFNCVYLSVLFVNEWFEW